MKQFLLIFTLLLIISCNKERPEPNFYKNLYTGEILNKTEFVEFGNSLLKKNSTSNEKLHINWVFYKLEKSSDSIVQNFKYDLRIGDEYLVRSKKYEKIGMKIPKQDFKLIDGEKITIGGIRNKPTLINLWFIHCPGCISEMPELNRLREKYSKKVNFISLTFEKEEDILDFLKKRKFEFTHIANVEDFIKKLVHIRIPKIFLLIRMDT